MIFKDSRRTCAGGGGGDLGFSGFWFNLLRVPSLDLKLGNVAAAGAAALATPRDGRCCWLSCWDCSFDNLAGVCALSAALSAKSLLETLPLHGLGETISSGDGG